MARRIIRKDLNKGRRLIRPGITINRLGNVSVVRREGDALSYFEARSIAKKSR